MITPNIRYYAILEYTKQKIKTPKYVISAQAGDYPPMEELKSRDGRVYMYLCKPRGKSIYEVDVSIKVVSNNLNFTGMECYFTGREISGFAFGYPHPEKTYKRSGKEKPNPFYDYKDDGFLFIVHQDENALTEAEQLRPSYIELIVLAHGGENLRIWCKQLLMGGFNKILAKLREQAI